MHLVIGHIGHWWTSAFYLAPVVIVGAALAVSERRARRRDGDNARRPQDGASPRDAHHAG